MAEDQGYQAHGRAIRGMLRRARRRIIGFLALRTALRAMLLALAAALLLAGLSHLTHLPALGRIILLGGGLLALGGLLLYGLGGALRRYGALEQTARALDRRFPELKNRLESALEFLERGPDHCHYSPELTRAAVRQTAELVGEPGEARRLAGGVLERYRADARREGWLALGLAAVLAGAALLDPSGLSRLARDYRHPLALLTAERNFRLAVQPGNLTILRGDTVTVSGTGSIPRPGPMTIHFWQAGEPRGQAEMSAVSGSAGFEHLFAGLENDLSYVVSQGRTASDTFRITVTSNPFVTELRLRFEYPEHTGLEPFETMRDRAIQALYGTRVVLSGRASNPLAEARLVLGPDSSRLMAAAGERGFLDTLVLREDGGYRIALRDRWGLTNPDTLSYPITVLRDEPPVIVLKFPEDGALLDESLKQPLVYEAADDFGLSRVELIFHKESIAGRVGKEQLVVIGRGPGRERENHRLGQYLWELGELRLVPQDEVVYRLRVFDNDRLSGPKSAITPEFRVRFPSLEEIFQGEQQRQQEITGDLQQLERQGTQLREQVEQMSQALERGRQLNWENEQQLRQAAREQQQLVEQVQELARRLEGSIRQLQRGEMMSSELLEKMTQVQQLMEEVATGELKEAMSKLQQALERQLDPRQLAEAVEQLKLSQEQILEKMDKTIALLEKVKLEQQLDYLVKQTAELAGLAERLADSTASRLGEPVGERDSPSVAPRDTAAGAAGERGREDGPQEPDRQSRPEAGNGEDRPRSPEEDQAQGNQAAEGLPELAEELGTKGEQVFEELAETGDNLQRMGERELAEKLAREGEPGQRESFREQLAGIERNLQQGRLGQAGRQERELTEEARQRHQRMQEYRDQLKQEWRNEVSQAMARAFDDLNWLSRRQEELYQAVQAEPDINHPDVLGYAAEQQDINAGLEEVLQSLLAASRDNFFISPQLLAYLEAAVEHGNESAARLQEEVRRKDQADRQLQQSLAVTNASMLLLIDDRQGLLQSASGTGMDQMMQQLEQMARRQEELNRQMQEAMQQNSQGSQGPSGQSGMLPSLEQGGQMPGQADLMSMLRQMAAEQQAIREQAAQLAEQLKGRRQLGSSSAEGAAEEAEQVLEDIRRRGVTEETLERQRRILDRLLDAQVSMQERDAGKERKSERPGEYEARPPAALEQELLERAGKDSALRAVLERWKGQYPESFEALVRDYFELIRSRELEP